MAKDLFPEIEDDEPANGARGSSTQILLIVLLFLLLVFGYLYFFTSLIKPREGTAKSATPQPAQIRQPLPPRPNQEVGKPAAAAKPEEKQPAQAKAERPATPPTPPQAKPAPPQVVAAPSQEKPASPQVKPAAVPPRPTPAKAVKAEEKPVHKEQVKAAPVPAAPVAPQQKVAAKPLAKAHSVAKKTPEPAAPQQTAKTATEHGAFTLLAGEFAVGRELKGNRAKLKKLGISPVHEKKIEKLQIMYRLFLADLDSHYAADMELQKLEKVTTSAFLLEQNGRFAVYAGSYLHKSGAVAEQKHLAGKGFTLSIKSAKVTIPLTRVTAGSFSSNEDAGKEAVRLQKQGIKARVIKTGK